jgi:cytochrome c-type biogenesis protein CcmH/NrfF
LGRRSPTSRRPSHRLGLLENLSVISPERGAGLPGRHWSHPDGADRFRRMKPQAASSRQRKRRVAVAPTALLTLRRVAVTGFLVALTALGSLALAPHAARADEPAAATAPDGRSPEELERIAESIAQSIMSPFCPGRTVSACPVAGPWRDDIRKMVAEGVEPDEIKRRLAERVPEHNLMGVPKNRLGWVLPVGLGIIAIGILVLLLRYLVGPRASGGTTSGADPKPIADTSPEATSPEAIARAKADPNAVARANGEDYDERLDQELETFEQ